ncbi:MAG: cation-translocating P-type ATPase [Pseudomonadota bacterium]
MSSTAIAIDDMHCAACIRKVRTAITELSFVQGFSVNPVRRQIQVEHALADGDFKLLETIEALGFHPRLTRQARADHRTERRTALKRLGIAGICMMQVMMATLALYFGDFWGMSAGAELMLRWALLAFCLPIAGYCAVPFYRSAIASLRQGINMDVPIALAIAVAFTVSVQHLFTGAPHLYFDRVAMFTFLLLGARAIDSSLKRTISTDDERFAAPPEQVHRWDGAGWVSAPISQVAPGDSLRIDEGAALPVDLTLTSSQAQLDKATLTGESQWVAHRAGDTLYAGTFNRGAQLTGIANSSATDSRASQITRLAEQVALSRSPLARMADRVAAVFVPVVLGLAGLTALGWALVGDRDPVSAGLAVLIVSCPCALALAVPAALSASMATLRRKGLLLGDSAVLEAAPEMTQLYFDKTGTLTHPRLQITHQVALGDWPIDRCRLLAQALQSHSTHPIASAFTTADRSDGAAFELTAVETVTGAGIRGHYAGREVRMGHAAFCSQNAAVEPSGAEGPDDAQGIFLSIDGRALARFRLGAAPRADFAETLERLQRQGVRMTLLSGDAEQPCRELAAPLELAYAAALSPEEKLRYIESHRGPDDKVMFVGDGINDGPAFAAADIAVATLETSDLVRARADATLLSARLLPLAALFEQSQRTRTVVRQNLAWAAGYNLIAIPCAMAGLMPPWLAAVGMASSSMLVLLNATRLLQPMPSGRV